jgi:tetratricopeptide (TPR) repeat protein
VFEPERFRERLERVLSHVTPAHVGAVSGTAVLCAASALALPPETWPAVLPWIGAIGQNVLAGLLQQQLQELADEPSVDEQERLTKLAQALQGEIERDARLRVEVGAFLDELDAVDIAEEVLRGNQALHGWLLVQIRRDVMKYGSEFARMHESLARIEAMLGVRQAPPGPPLQRPPRAPHFTGREAELRDLLAQLQPGAVVTLCGPGGIGKTALAAEAIWTLAPGDEPPERFPDGIFFHTFYNQPEAALALEAIARAYGEEPRPSPRDAAARALGGRVALLVLDGAENADDLGAVLGVAGRCGVLITTRRHTDAPAGWRDLQPLPNPLAVELLQAWGGDRAADTAAAARICTLVGALPLAVRLAGRYIAQHKEEAAEYMAWLEETPLAALHFGDRQRESAQVLMERSAAQLSGAACQALGVVGVLALASFDRSAVAAALELSAPAAGRALGELVDYGLLLRDEERRYQASHALIRTYARERLSPAVEVVGRLAGHYTAMAEEQSQSGLAGYAQLDVERAHFTAVLARCEESEAWEAVLGLTWAVTTVGGYLDLRGYWTERVVALEVGVSAARALGRRYDEGAFLNHLGLTSRGLGQVQRAIEYHEQALTIYREICAASTQGSPEWTAARRSEGANLGNLGVAYKNLGQAQRAIEYDEQALSISREICAASTQGSPEWTAARRAEGTQLGNLGIAHRQQGEGQRAIEYYQQALRIAQEIGDRRGKGNQFGNLGVAYADLGKVQRAIDYYEQALAVAREIGDRLAEGNSLGNLGNAYFTLGEARRAIKYHDQALTISREIGDRHGEGANLGNLGIAYTALGEARRAIEYLEQALAIFEEIQSPYAQLARTKLAELLSRQP